jgi:hypothetical protein
LLVERNRIPLKGGYPTQKGVAKLAPESNGPDLP